VPARHRSTEYDTGLPELSDIVVLQVDGSLQQLGTYRPAKGNFLSPIFYGQRGKKEWHSQHSIRKTGSHCPKLLNVPFINRAI